MTRYAAIAGWGKYLPQRVLTNTDLERMVATSDEWIRERTGIAERRLASEGECSSTLAVRAARQALQQADLPAFSLDLIILATSTPDHFFPATACLVQDALGAIHAGAFDLEAACSGFLYALTVGTQLIRGGLCENILVVATETLSRFVNWQDRSTCVLFGDGAGAAVLRATDRRRGLISSTLGAYGAGGELLILPAGGSARPATQQTLDGGQHFIHMKGNQIFRFAVRKMSEAALEVLEKAGLSLEELDLFVPHQANLRIIQAVGQRLNLPEERIFVNLQRYGNMSAATIPIALCEAAESGLLQEGHVVVASAFGAGLTWAGALLIWGRP
ncbi:MAG: ketoacyl-ACP synthase III [Chloroflexia bacterium]|nr:ketoacyl-ACP synthase III [Chloroflexia bacterium]